MMSDPKFFPNKFSYQHWSMLIQIQLFSMHIRIQELGFTKQNIIFFFKPLVSVHVQIRIRGVHSDPDGSKPATFVSICFECFESACQIMSALGSTGQAKSVQKEFHN